MVGKGHLQSLLLDIGGMEVNEPDLGDKLGDETKVLKNARIFSLSLLGAKLWRFLWNFPVASHSAGKEYKYSEALNVLNHFFGIRVCFNAFRISLWSFAAVRAGKLFDAERY
ncbi:hypothetical protein AVEN_236323-1 [Araneus ventricosus]|uniref:Uncharacterized protein n=1 Tax=Araneus ventricosus TaxID=182803 RepID=A0A4Y2JMK1_ARAVE|nr:hypothetical protein AVEN_236323-1 [Araneus ventricosus]